MHHEEGLIDPNLNQRILNAEKNCVLISIPIGLIFALLTYFITEKFQLFYSTIIGIGAFAAMSTVLFHFHYGKGFPKRKYEMRYVNKISLFKQKTLVENSAIQAWNRANGNPGSNFILPRRYLD